jgi:hypothetical protein
MSQEAKATSRKATGIHNRVDRAGKPEIPASKEGRRGTGAPLNETMRARKWRCKIDTLYECNRSLLKSCRRSQRTMDLGAVCGESRTHGSEGGRVPRGTDLSHSRCNMARPRSAPFAKSLPHPRAGPAPCQCWRDMPAGNRHPSGASSRPKVGVVACQPGASPLDGRGTVTDPGPRGKI